MTPRDAAVLPAVLIGNGLAGLPQKQIKFSTIYESKIKTNDHRADGPIDALSRTGIVSVSGGRAFLVQHGTLENTTHSGAVWRIRTDTNDKWHSTVKANTWSTFSDIGKIRVGVKTCADKVFVRTDWPKLESERPELLLPLTTHHDLHPQSRQGRSKAMGKRDSK